MKVTKTRALVTTTACSVVLAGLMSGSAMAFPQYKDVLTQKYNIAAGSKLDSCGVCHDNPDPNATSPADKTRNVYGKDIEAEDIKQMQDPNWSGEIDTDKSLTAVEGLDSDGDGYTNKDELLAGFFPGEAQTDHPTGDTSGNGGGDTGGNTGGDTGGSTGGDTGGNTGGDSGGTTGGDTGGNTGGDTGGSTGGDTGGSTGGDTGNTGGITGGDTGGNAGGDTGNTGGTTGGDTSGITGGNTGGSVGGTGFGGLFGGLLSALSALLNSLLGGLFSRPLGM